MKGNTQEMVLRRARQDGPGPRTQSTPATPNCTGEIITLHLVGFSFARLAEQLIVFPATLNTGSIPFVSAGIAMPNLRAKVLPQSLYPTFSFASLGRGVAKASAGRSSTAHTAAQLIYEYVFRRHTVCFGTRKHSESLAQLVTAAIRDATASRSSGLSRPLQPAPRRLSLDSSHRILHPFSYSST